MNTLKKAVLGTLAAAGLATAAFAASPSAAPNGGPPSAHGDWHDSHGGGWGHGRRHHRGDLMMHALKQLNLTDKQKESIHGVMKSARPQFESLFGQIRENQRTLMTTAPNDPSYAGTLATAKTLAANMVQQRSDLRTKVYGVLTPEQKAKLPQIFADMKAHFEKRRAEFEQKRKQWEQDHPNGGPGSKGGTAPASNS